MRKQQQRQHKVISLFSFHGRYISLDRTVGGVVSYFHCVIFLLLDRLALIHYTRFRSTIPWHGRPWVEHGVTTECSTIRVIVRALLPTTFKSQFTLQLCPVRYLLGKYLVNYPHKVQSENSLEKFLPVQKGVIQETACPNNRQDRPWLSPCLKLEQRFEPCLTLLIKIVCFFSFSNILQWLINVHGYSSFSLYYMILCLYLCFRWSCHCHMWPIYLTV